MTSRPAESASPTDPAGSADPAAAPTGRSAKVAKSAKAAAKSATARAATASEPAKKKAVAKKAKAKASATEPARKKAVAKVTAKARARYPHGVVVGKFYPPHAGHHLLIRTAAQQCVAVTVVVAPSRQESISLADRMRWLREIHRDTPWVRFVDRYDDAPVDYHDPAAWDAHMAVFREAAGGPVDAVFTSEDYGPELARRFGAKHVAVDPPRAAAPVSGTAVRDDPIGHWSWLEPPVRAWFTRRIVVVGAESTGTSTLTRDLARHYRARGGVWADTTYVREYGRYLTARKLAALREQTPDATIFDVSWDDADFVEVATRQNRAEDAAARRGSPIMFADTDARATLVWQERYLGRCTDQVRQAARTRRPDLYLLTEHEDVPFHDDGLRDGEQQRPWMTERFAEVISATGVPLLRVGGDRAQRLKDAAAMCDVLLGMGWFLAPPTG
jgi:HTH-type transcriptional regulator, transcriptional repressor of NAD biosynthesis genes